jgi:ketosteroid isomerase-like protein
LSQENVELVRAMLKAWTESGFPAMAEFAHPDFEMRQMAQHFLSGTYRGADATKSMTDFIRHFEDFGAEVEDVIDAGDDRVVVAVREHGRPRGGTVEMEQLFGVVYTLRDRKVLRMEWFDSPAAALRAVGLEAE